MHMFTIFVLNLNKLNTTTIPTSNSWLLHIIKIYTLEYIVKQIQKQDYNSFHHNLTLQKIHTKDEHRFHCRSKCFSILLKT